MVTSIIMTGAFRWRMNQLNVSRRHSDKRIYVAVHTFKGKVDSGFWNIRRILFLSRMSTRGNIANFLWIVELVRYFFCKLTIA